LIEENHRLDLIGDLMGSKRRRRDKKRKEDWEESHSLARISEGGRLLSLFLEGKDEREGPMKGGGREGSAGGFSDSLGGDCRTAGMTKSWIV